MTSPANPANSVCNNKTASDPSNPGQLEQPWGDDRLKLNGVYIGCVTKQNADILIAQDAISRCVYQFIDRMNDVCPEDTADTIMAEFTKVMAPLIEADLKARFPNMANR